MSEQDNVTPGERETPPPFFFKPSGSITVSAPQRRREPQHELNSLECIKPLLNLHGSLISVLRANGYRAGGAELALRFSAIHR